MSTPNPGNRYNLTIVDAVPLLPTKLTIPTTPRDMVIRSQLVRKLNQGLNCRLMLVSGQAGAGKTTLLANWLQQREFPAAWIALDPTDSQPAKFLSYLVAAIEVLLPGKFNFPADLSGLTHQDRIEPVLSILVNKLCDLTEDAVLILDDYHHIEDPAVDQLVTLLLEHSPPEFHLVISTRADPSLPLARLRARGELLEIRTDDLRFTFEQSAQFLNQVMSLALEPAQISALESRTEGWIAGLKLAALSLRGQDRHYMANFIETFSVSHRYVLDFLTDEVLLQQSQEVQSFLLLSSILDRLTGSLCQAVTGFDSSQAILEQLETTNLFIVSLDAERRWYRYHHLFADLLRNRLETTYPALLPTLHHRASDWYENHGLPADAIHHAIAIPDFSRLEHLIQDHVLTMVFNNQLSPLSGWLSGLPDEALHQHPWLNIASAWVMTFSGNLAGVEDRLTQLEGALDDWSGTHKSNAQVAFTSGEKTPSHLAGHIAIVRGCLYSSQGDIGRTLKFASQALDLLPTSDKVPRSMAMGIVGESRMWRETLDNAVRVTNNAIQLSQEAGTTQHTIGLLGNKAMLQYFQARLNEAYSTCQTAIRLALEQFRHLGFRPGIISHVNTRLSHIYLQWNQIASALKHARDSLALCTLWGQKDLLTSANIALAACLQANGQEEEALAAIDEARHTAISPWIMDRVLAMQARILLRQGNLEAADRWARDHNLSPDDEINMTNHVTYRSLALLLVSQGQLAQALNLLGRLQNLNRSHGWVLNELYGLVLESQVYQAQGKPESALQKLGLALNLARPANCIYAFASNGSGMTSLLQQAVAQGIQNKFTTRLLQALDVTSSQPEYLAEPLSERELQILRLLGTHLSRPQIASQLYLSENTIRSHIKSIYRKLDVRSRQEALLVAEKLRLI